MTDWLRELADLGDTDAVLVTVAGVRGSAPREVGATMLVTGHDSRGTIGGGELEYQCQRIAAGMLGNAAGGGRMRRFPLGSNCGQCCGGVVDVLFEPLARLACRRALQEAWAGRVPAVLVTELDTEARPQRALVTPDAVVAGQPSRAATTAARRLLADSGAARRVDIPGRGSSFLLLQPLADRGLDVAVFGAGHVGSALVRALASLDCHLRWIDSRRSVFPEAVPANVRCIESAEPVREIAALPAGTDAFVMTHSHALDLELVSALLARRDLASVGLIGSRTKRRRFERKLRERGLDDAAIGRLRCPIGIDGIAGKAPAEIAISAAAELLRLRDIRASNRQRGGADVHVLRPGRA